MTEAFPRVGEIIFQVVFVLVMGLMVVGGPVLAVLLARASFKDPNPAPGPDQATNQ